SIEWARIEPEEGEFSLAQLEHYRRMLAACHEHAIKPVVTLHHFTSPRWIAARGGWESADTAPLFARYCERVAKHLGDLFTIVCTINELNLGIILQQSGFLHSDDAIVGSRWRHAAARMMAVEPEMFSSFPFCVRSRSRDVLLEAHRRAAQALHSAGNCAVGMTLAMLDLQAVPGAEDVRDRAAAESQDLFLQAARADDFIGVQCYTRQRIGPRGPLPPEAGAEYTQMGYELWPNAVQAVIRQASAIAQVPIVVTESGIATDDDSRRINFMEQVLSGIAQCLHEGIDVRGYFYWSLLDNFEWLFGYGPKFGLIEVDRTTQRRKVKPSAEWLGRTARNNEI
ncbi:MAG: family 1 glycosylhydrolase, partial [Deltaproteobacteria bacterium]|nr:family 1 glycosylhydrolase [Deltaproteobacteria bacterium]